MRKTLRKALLGATALLSVLTVFSLSGCSGGSDQGSKPRATMKVRCSPKASASARPVSSRADSKALLERPRVCAGAFRSDTHGYGKHKAESGHSFGVGCSAGSGRARSALSCGATAAPIRAGLLRGSDAAQKPTHGTAWRRSARCAAEAPTVREITS